MSICRAFPWRFKVDVSKYWLLAAAIALSGCASRPDAPPLTNTQAQYDAHVARFDEANPHTTHRLLRPDGHTIVAREFGVRNKSGLDSSRSTGTGKTYILMHGFPDNQHLYDELIPILAKNNHVVSFDFLGWGASDKPSPNSYAVNSQRVDLDTVIARLQLDQVALVVHDLSGQVGIDWALDNARRTDELVLLNSYYLPMPTLKAPDAIEFYSKPGVLRDLAMWGANKVESRFKEGVAHQLYAFMSNSEARNQYIPVIAHSAPSIRPAFFSSVSALWSELYARGANTARMQAFVKPVRIIFGQDDPFLNPGVAASFAELFKNNCKSLIPKANHYVQLDAPALTAQAILAPFKTNTSCGS
jgi:haloalkane dehalogenase